YTEHLAGTRHLRGGLLGNRTLRLLEKQSVIVAHGTDGQAAGTVTEGAHDAQQPLPDPEPLVSAQGGHLGPRARRGEELPERLQDRGEAELLREGGALALVEVPVLHGVGGTGVEAAGAGLADADLLPELAVRLERGVGQDDGGVAPRSRLPGEEVQLQAERSQPCLDGHVARGEKAVARVLHLPHGLLRRRLEGPVARLLEEARQPIAHLVHLPKDELIDVMHAGGVARAKGADGNALEEG